MSGGFTLINWRIPMTEIPITYSGSGEMICLSKPCSKTQLTVGKRYSILERSIINKDCVKVRTDNGRAVWYHSKHFKNTACNIKFK